jgi:hypothetical protein
VSKGAAAALAATIAFLVYNANGREIGSYDSQPAKFLAIEIATRGSLSLGRVVGRIPLLAERPAFAVDRRGNYRSAYPLPSAVAAGGVAWVLSKVHAIDLSAPRAPGRVAKITASALTALTVAFAFLASARRVSVPHAMLVALAMGLGTNLWASVSQTLWQQETALCGLMGAVWLLGAPKGTIGRALAAGAFLGVAAAARPQVAPAVAMLAAAMIVRWGRQGAIGVAPIAIAVLSIVAINLSWFGHPLGAVPQLEALHPQTHGLQGSFQWQPWASAAGLLVSPSRGLLVFSPIVAFAALGFARARREGWHSDLAWCAAAAAAQFTLYSFYGVWWGGHTFGPRYALDWLPMLVPLAAAGLPVTLGSRALRWSAAACLAWSIAAAGAGAFIYPADAWNTDPADVDRAHDRLWDWRDSQLERCARAPWSPQNFSLFAGD